MFFYTVRNHEVKYWISVEVEMNNDAWEKTCFAYVLRQEHITEWYVNTEK